MSTTTILVGTDLRAWVRFEVIDATPEEIGILDDIDSEQALTLARQLYAADRLSEVDVQHDDNPDYLSEYAHPAVIGCEVDG